MQFESNCWKEAREWYTINYSHNGTVRVWIDDEKLSIVDAETLFHIREARKRAIFNTGSIHSIKV